MSKYYHFIGIGGIGMAGLAALVLEQGHNVCGSDIKDNELIVKLRARGANIFIGHASNQVTSPDYVVVSSAIKFDNDEYLAAAARNIPILKRAQLLAQLMASSIGITVAGAHGKTTTSSMITHVLNFAGVDPTSAIGGIVQGLDSNFQSGGGKYFVAEVDESDGSFLLFKPKYSVITNIDKEHLDYYGSFEAIQKAYAEFIECTENHGSLIICGEDKVLSKIVKQHNVPYTTYGFLSRFDLWASDIICRGFSSSFTCHHQENILGEITINFPGKHNVLNALACIQVALFLEIDFQTIKNALAGFTGVRRRFQLIGEARDIKVIDDYAHHPTEILKTLEAAQSFNAQRIVVVFQPHRYSRLESLFKEFVQCFSLSDYLVITDIYAASEDPRCGVSSEKLVLQVQAEIKKPVIYLPQMEVLNHLYSHLHQGDLVLMLGAGDITHLAQELYQGLRMREKITSHFKAEYGHYL